MSIALERCPLCKSIHIKQYSLSGGADMYRIICNRCGEFITSYEFLVNLCPQPDFQKTVYLLSGLSRELTETQQGPVEFLVKNYEKILKHHLIPPPDNLDEKVTKLLTYIKEKTTHYGAGVEFENDRDFPLAYAQTQEEFLALIKLLIESKLVTEHTTPKGQILFLTAEGWRRSSVLMSQGQSSSQGFVAIWFDPTGSMDESIEAISTAIKEEGFKPMCIKNEHFPDKIMDKALGEIRRSKFVVVDLTGARPSVFFEAGFANGLGIDAIYVYKKGSEKDASTLDFYTKHYQCYSYENFEELKERLKDILRARYTIQ